MNRPVDSALPAALQAVLDTVPATDAEPSLTQRQAAWERLHARLHDPARTPFTDEVRAPIELVDDTAEPVSAGPRVTPHVVPRATGRMRLYAAAALVLVVGGASWATGSTTYRVPRGAPPQSFHLADGSTAWVAPGGAVQVSRRLGWPSFVAPESREVRLDGEAYFDVQRDGRPFRVNASPVQVQVLGTRFAVRGGAAVGVARVQVDEGRVAVMAGRAREELGAGEGVTLRNGSLQRRTFDATRVATWRTGGLAALDESLGDVLDELARRFDVEITVDRDVDADAVVSLFYPVAPAVDIVLGDLCTAQSLVFQRTSRGFHIGRP